LLVQWFGKEKQNATKWWFAMVIHNGRIREKNSLNKSKYISALFLPVPHEEHPCFHPQKKLQV